MNLLDIADSVVYTLMQKRAQPLGGGGTPVDATNPFGGPQRIPDINNPFAGASGHVANALGGSQTADPQAARTQRMTQQRNQIQQERNRARQRAISKRQPAAPASFAGRQDLSVGSQLSTPVHNNQYTTGTRNTGLSIPGVPSNAYDMQVPPQLPDITMPTL